MKHSSYVAACGVCRVGANEEQVPGGVIWEDDRWLVRHAPAPYPLVGWLFFQTQRHVQGPAHFDDAEAKAFGPVLRHVSRALEQVSGAPRVYFVAFGESTPHMHAHLAPRYASLKPDEAAFGIADLYRNVSKGARPAADSAKVLEIVDRLRDALKKSPPPR